MFFKRRHLIGRLLGVCLVAGFSLSMLAQSFEGPEGDYGDAPDNIFANYTSFNPFVEAEFPSEYDNLEDQFFVLHRFPADQVFFGTSVTLENNALLIDQDEDDGWVPGSFIVCTPVELELFVSMPANAPSGPVYLNSLFDWNHDGVWLGGAGCPDDATLPETEGPTATPDNTGSFATEWGIQNLRLDQAPYNVGPGFAGTLTMPAILSGPFDGEMWIRYTLTRVPVDEQEFGTASAGGSGWNGSGDFTYGESEDYFSCVVLNPDSLPARCPNTILTLAQADPEPEDGNRPPQAISGVVNTPEDTPVNITLEGIDPDNDPLTYTVITSPNNGTLFCNGSDCVYTPDPNFNGIDSFVFQVDDGNGGTSTGVIIINVDPLQDPPVADDVVRATGQNTPVGLQLPVSDPDNDPLTCRLVSGPSNGTVVVNADCSATYTPNNGYIGPDDFTYEVNDGNGGTDTGTVTLNVSPNAPTAVPQSLTTPEDTALPVLLTGTDPNGDPLTFSIVTPPAHGTISGFNPTTGELIYTPDPNYNGPDAIVFQVDDGTGGVDTATISIDVTPVNDDPIAVDDARSLNEDGSISIPVLTNDSDPDGDTLSIVTNTPPSNGTVVCSTTDCTYLPDPNFNGTDTFTYTISDGNGGTDTATVTLTVNPVNDPPVANDDNPTIDEDMPVTIPVLANDSDPDGDPLTITGNTPAGNGTVSCSATECDYTPDPNFNGTDTFTYTIDDGNGGTDIATVTVTVNPVNDDPIANDDAETTDEDTPVTVDVLVNDSDPDGDPITITGNSNPGNGSVTCSSTECVYTPNSDFNGTDTFTYTIDDGNGATDTATVTVSVNPINDPPVANDDSESTSEDNAVIIDVLVNDDDPDGDPLTITGNTQPNNGAVTCTASECSYTPDPNFNGTDTFTYTISDGNGGSDTATVTVTVDSVNDDPIANDDVDSTGEDSPVTVDVLANDSDPDGDPLEITSNTQPSNGVVACSASDCVYTPNSNFNGTDTFTYTIGDGNGGSDTATVTINVSPVNDPPVANDDSDTTDEDTPVTVDVLANDSDVDGDALTITGNTQPSNGSVSCSATECVYTPDTNFNGTDTFDYTISDGNGGTDTATVTIDVGGVNDVPNAVDDLDSTDEDTPVTVSVLTNDSDPDGDPLTVTGNTQPSNGSVSCNSTTCTYTPNNNFNGTDTFDYTISDGNGGTDTATVTVTVDPINDPPVANDDTESTGEDSPVTIDVLANDDDVDGDPLTITGNTQPSNGSVTCTASDCVYTPDPNFNGTDTFNYTISDGNGGTDTATVTVTVDPVNDDPIANDDAETTDEDTAVLVDVLANDSDPDGDSLTISSNTQPSNGTVICTSLTCGYTPDPNFNGTDTFTYTISDGNGGSDTATVTITVNPVNDPPVANDDSDTTSEDTPVTVPVLNNDSDLDGDPLTITGNTQPSNGSVTCSSTDCTYTPDVNFNGVDTFDYTISDGNGGTDTATVTVMVDSVNDAPVAVDDSDTTNEDTPVTVAVLTNDSDPDGDTLTVVGNTQPSNGSVSCNGTTCEYTPDPNFNGVDTFDYTISDGNGGTDTATVTITVDAVNDAPNAVDDSDTTNEDTPVTVAVLSNDSDPDGDPLTVVGNTQPGNGSVTCNGTTCTYTPNNNFNGQDSFTYTISDGNGGTDTATVTIDVTPVNDAPIAADDTDQTDEDTPVTVDVLANDSDPDGDTLTIIGNTQPGNGTVSCTSSECVYTPDTNFNGTDTFDYTISDGNGGTDTATVTITIGGVNDAPNAVDDADSTNEDTPVTVSVLNNDSDPDGDTLTVVGNTQPSNGSVTCNGTTCTYTPNSNFNGQDSFTYTISDGNGGSDTATVTITVDPVNDPPVAADDTDSTNEDTPITVAVLNNDSDPDGDPLTVTGNTQPFNGSVTCNGTTCEYTPNPNFNGLDSFTYTISDGNGGTDTALVTITVVSVNDEPVAVDDADSTNEDTPVTVSVLTNDSDPDGDPLTVTSNTQPSNGSVTCNGVTCTYTPDANFNGVDTFDYTISDGNGGTDTATVTINVNAVNDAPVAVDDADSTNEDTPVTVSVLTNDSDPDGDPLTVTGNTQPSNGAVTCNGTTCTYTPDANFNGTDTFDYTISDGNGGTDTATVTITVNAVNDAPIALDDVESTNEDTPVEVFVLPNDSDPDGDLLTVTSNTQPNNGSVTCNGATCTYTPDNNFNGVDTFDYTISDGNGGTDTATVTITVNPVNDAPIAVDDADSTDEDTPVQVFVLPNDSDPDGDPLTVTGNTQPNNGSVSCNGTTCTYTPNANFNGIDRFDYTISDGNGGTDTATVTITVGSVNDVPVAVDDADSTNEDTPVTVSVLNNDSDPDGDTLTVINNTQPTNGSVTCNGTTCTYTPDTNFNGVDTFDYTISDGNGGTDTATVTITVDAVNDAPIAVDDFDTTDEDVPVTVSVLTNDSDPDGDPLTVINNTQPSNGSVSCNGTTCTYTPDVNFNGVDTFNYTISDGNGGTDTATVTITVGGVNDAPVAVDDVDSTDEDTPVTVSVLNNDSDPDGDPLTVINNTQPNNGAVTCNGTTCTYTPDANFNGVDTFNYTISDGNGGTDTATVTITVDAVNDTPDAVDDADSTDEDTPVTVSVLNNDSDPDGDPLTVINNTQPSNGAVTCNGTTCTYTPNPNFNGVDTFNYTISDGNGGTDTATVTITVDAVNDPPNAVDDADSTDEDTPVTVSVLNNDSDPDGDTLTVTGNTPASNGSVTCNGTTCTYTPNPNFNGVDTFTYTISDGNGGTDTATVTITVDAVNDPPNAVDDADSTDEDTPVTVAVLNNDSDPDGDALTVTGNTQGFNGSVSCNGTTCTYTPNPNFNGLDSFTYTISDGNGGTDTALVTITVDGVNDAPIAVDDADSTDEDTPVTVAVLSNDSDPDGDPLTVTGNTQPSNGSATCNGTTCTYTPDANFNGVDTFTYTISDGNGGTDTATVTITVDAVNDPPNAVDDGTSTDEDTPVQVFVLTNDSDPDGDSLTVISNSQPGNGSVSCNATTCTYTPDTNFSGVDTFTYTISDGNGGTDTATVTVAVDEVNDPPVANDDFDTTDEDTPVTVSVLNNDSDPDGDTLTVAGNTQPSNGSVTCNTTTCTYTPDANFNGTDMFTYTISDGNGGTDTAIVTITVDAVNDPPNAVDDTATVNEDSAVNIPVLNNDSDPDGDSLTVVSNTPASNGSVNCNSTTCTYSPDANFNGVDTFTYTISDGNGGTDTATVTVTVDPVNDPPNAVNDTATVDEDDQVTISVLNNDSDPDGDTITITSNSQPGSGTVFCSSTTCTYTPNNDFAGVDTFTYTISDGNGGTDTAVVTVTVLEQTETLRVRWWDASNPDTNEVPTQDDDVFSATLDDVGFIGEGQGAPDGATACEICNPPLDVTVSGVGSGTRTITMCLTEELNNGGNPGGGGPVAVQIFHVSASGQVLIFTAQSGFISEGSCITYAFTVP